MYSSNSLLTALHVLHLYTSTTCAPNARSCSVACARPIATALFSAAPQKSHGGLSAYDIYRLVTNNRVSNRCNKSPRAYTNRNALTRTYTYPLEKACFEPSKKFHHHLISTSTHKNTYNKRTCAHTQKRAHKHTQAHRHNHRYTYPLEEACFEPSKQLHHHLIRKCKCAITRVNLARCGLL